MAYYKRRKMSRKRRRTTSYKKRTFKRRKAIIPRSMRNGNAIHLKMRLPDKLIVNDTVVEQAGAFNIRLQDLTNYSNYTTIWDQYRINKIVVRARPIRTTTVVAQVEDVSTPQGTTNIPSYCLVKDFDDSITPSSFTQLEARTFAKRRLATQSMSYKFTPATLTSIYQPITSAYAPKYKTWLDCAFPAVPHYGIKFAMEVAAPAGVYGIELVTDVYVSFKNRFK